MENKSYKEYLIYFLVTTFLLLFLTIFAMISEAYEVDTSVAIIHHTASPDWPVERFRQIHVKERGWEDVGYHFIIRKDGRIEEGRSLNRKGAHARGRNKFVGIALTGYDQFSSSQIKSLKALLKRLQTKRIEPHHEECPGKGLDLEAIKWR